MIREGECTGSLQLSGSWRGAGTRRVMELSGGRGVGAEQTGTSGCGAWLVSRCGPEADGVTGKALVCVALNGLRDTTQLPENVRVVGMKLRPVLCSGVSGFFYSAFKSFFMRKPVFISFYYFSPLLRGITL